MSSKISVLLGSIGRSQALVDVIGRITGSRKLDKTRFREVLLEGLLLFVYPNLLSSGSIYRLEGGGEVLR